MFKLVVSDHGNALERRAEEFTERFLWSEDHLNLIGRIYAALVVAIGDPDVSVRKVIEVERERFRQDRSLCLLSESDRECAEWVLDRACDGERPARRCPQMHHPIHVVTRVSEAVVGLYTALERAAPHWSWRLFGAMTKQLHSEPDYRKLSDEGRDIVSWFTASILSECNTVEAVDLE
ncbi:MAG TPA: hypothetical protein VGC86_12830 [Afipia sp.]